MKRSAVWICFSVLSLLPFAHNATVEFCEHGGRNKNADGYCTTEILSQNCANVESEYLRSISYVDPFDDCVSIYEDTNCQGRTMDLRRDSPDRQFLQTADFNDILSSFKLCKPKPTVIEVKIVVDDGDHNDDDDTGVAAKDYSTNEVSTNSQANNDLNKPWPMLPGYSDQQSGLREFYRRHGNDGIAFPERNQVSRSIFDRLTVPYFGNRAYRTSPVYTEQIIINPRNGPPREWFYYKI